MLPSPASRGLCTGTWKGRGGGKSTQSITSRATGALSDAKQKNVYRMGIIIIIIRLLARKSRGVIALGSDRRRYKESLAESRSSSSLFSYRFHQRQIPMFVYIAFR